MGFREWSEDESSEDEDFYSEEETGEVIECETEDFEREDAVIIEELSDEDDEIQEIEEE